MRRLSRVPIPLDAPVASSSGSTAADTDEEYDVVVIGSGIGGLSAASLLARYGYSVKLFESHYLAGGCCHMFDHRDKDGGLWRFEVGPSIWEGLDRPTGNPLRMVFDALDEEMPCETYDGISMWTTEGHWRFQVGDDEAPGGFCDLLREKSTDPGVGHQGVEGAEEPPRAALRRPRRVSTHRSASGRWSSREHRHRHPLLPHSPQGDAGHTVHPRLVPQAVPAVRHRAVPEAVDRHARVFQRFSRGGYHGCDDDLLHPWFPPSRRFAVRARRRDAGCRG